MTQPIPPALAVLLVTLFSSAREAETILGDLSEEFHQIAAKTGVSAARHWYWRQAVRTVAHLFAEGLRTAPLPVLSVIAGVFLLRWFVSRLADPLVKEAIASALDTGGAFADDPRAYLFWLTYGVFTFRLFLNLLAGGLAAFLAYGREMTAAVALGIAGDLLAVQAIALTVSRTGDFGVIATLPHTIAFSLAIAVGGAAVRLLRGVPINGRTASR